MQEKSRGVSRLSIDMGHNGHTLAIYRVLKYCTPVFSKISPKVGSAKVSNFSQTASAATGEGSGGFTDGVLPYKNKYQR